MIHRLRTDTGRHLTSKRTWRHHAVLHDQWGLVGRCPHNHVSEETARACGDRWARREAAARRERLMPVNGRMGVRL